jgi:hypothetical protein
MTTSRPCLPRLRDLLCRKVIIGGPRKSQEVALALSSMQRQDQRPLQFDGSDLHEIIDVFWHPYQVRSIAIIKAPKVLQMVGDENAALFSPLHVLRHCSARVQVLHWHVTALT